MAHDAAQGRIDVEAHWTAGRRLVVGLLLAAGVGAAAAIVHALLRDDGHRRFMLAYLVAFAFVLSLSLGGLFFVLIQHLTRAGWSVLVRRFAESLAGNMPVVAALFLPIALSVASGHGAPYSWAQAGGSAHSAGEGGTHLNAIAFVARWAVLLAIWSAMGLYFWRSSVRQDDDRDHRRTLRMEKVAGPSALVFGLTVTFGAFDLLMWLDPHWYSTIFGIYYLSGGIVGALAAIILLAWGFQRAKAITGAISEAHYLDLGRLLFAFLFFWGYIAFCQYMLLWYANIPLTTSWLRARGMSTAAGDVNGWSYVALVLLFGHFLIPFAGLMSRHAKGRPVLLAIAAAWMLVMHYVDLLWVVMPQMGSELRLGAVEIGLLAAVGSVYALAVLRRLGGHRLMPVGDPRVAESAAHETVY